MSRWRKLWVPTVVALVASILVTLAGQTPPAVASGPARIFGVMSTVDGPFDGGNVTLLSPDGAWVAESATGSDGTFDFLGLAPGSYVIAATGAGLVPYGPRWDDPIVAEAGAEIDASFTADCFPTVTGRVVDAQGAPVNNASVEGFAEDSSFAVATGPDGRFRVVTPPGDYRLMVTHQLEDPVYVPVVLAANDTVDVGDIALPDLESISGTVTDRAGQPISGVTVDVWSGFRQATGITADDGRYSLNVGPGTFSVAFRPPAPYVGELYDDQPEGTTPTPVTVIEGSDTTDVNAVLAKTAVVRGTVRNQDGQPLIGVVVNSGGWNTTETNDAGTYEVADVRPNSPTLLTFTYRDLVTVDREVSPEDGEVLDLDVDIEVALATLSGVVRDESGDPVEGAEVTLLDGERRSQLTGADGRYEFVDIVTGTRIVEVRATGARIAEIPVDLPAGGLVHDIEMTFYGSISGVVTSGGVGQTDVVVSASNAAGISVDGNVGLDGHYKIPDLTPGAWTVGFWSWNGDLLPEFYDNASDRAAATPVIVEPRRVTTGIDADLDAPAQLTGVVTDQNGRPMADVRVVAAAGPGMQSETFTDSEGRYAIGHLVPGRYEVTFTWPPGSIVDVVEIASGASATLDAEISLPYGSVTGTVVDDTGAPLAGANVFDGNVVVATSDADGRFSVDNVVAGQHVYRIAVAFARDEYQIVDVAAGEVATVEVRVTIGGSVSGRLTVGQRAARLDEAHVALRSLDNSFITKVWEFGADGEFRFDLVPAGDYVVEVVPTMGSSVIGEWYPDAATRAAASVVTVNRGSVTTGIDIDAAEGATIAGAITLADGSPARYATVQDDDGRDVSADFYGKYRITGLRPGAHRLTFTYAGNSIRLGDGGMPAAVTVMGTELVNLDIHFRDATGTLRGVVTDTAGTPVVGASVAISISAPFGLPQLPLKVLTSGTDGSWEVADLQPRAYSVLVSKPGFVTATREVTLAARQALSVDVTLVSTAATLAGTVTDARGTPIAGASVKIVEGGPPQETVTGDDGRYELTGLVATSYWIMVEAPGFLWTKQRVTPMAGQTTNVGFVLSTGFTITGLVVDSSGAPVQGAVVTPTLYMGATRPAVTTAADGRYEALVPIGSYSATVVKPGFAQGSFTATSFSDGSVVEADVVLLRASTVRGRVVDLQGRGIRPTVFADRGASATISDDGSFEVTGLSPDNASISFSASGFAQTFKRLVIREGETVEGVEVVMRRLGTVTGRVLNSDGSAAAGRPISWRTIGDFSGAFGSAVTDVDGRFTIRGVVLRGSLLITREGGGVQAFDSDGDAQDDEFFIADGESVDAGTFRMPGFGSISGTVTIAGAPAAAVQVSVERLDRVVMAPPSVSTGADGRYVFTQLVPGTYRVMFRSPSAAVSSEYWRNTTDVASATPVTVRSDTETTAVDAELDPTATIDGLVLDPSGAPAVGARVDLYDGFAGHSATTDDNGRYSLADVAPGRHRLRIFSLDTEWQPIVDTVVVVGGERLSLRHSFVAGGTVTIQAAGRASFDFDGALCLVPARPIFGDQVTCDDGSSGAPFRLEFVDSRNWVLHGVAPGSYRAAWGFAPGGMSTVAEFTIVEGGVVACLFAVGAPSSCGGGGGGGVDPDRVPPAVTCSSPAPVLLLNATNARVSGTALDGQNESSVSSPADTSTVGRHSVELTSSDAAGNVGRATCAYDVRYRFSGFRSPVSNSRVNKVRYSQYVPLTWKLYDAQGTEVGLADAVVSVEDVRHRCPADVRLKSMAATPFAIPGLHLLRPGKFRYVWRPGRSNRKRCVTLTVTLDDGTKHSAEFYVR